MLVRIVGQAPLAATVYSLARLRCGARGQVFTAQEPEGVGPEKYDETAAAMIAQLKYGSGTPFYRLEQLEGRWSRYELIAIDELGYVPLAEVGAELLFQVIADRAEKTAVIITTNLPFSEWPQVFPNARLCKAMLDRLTDRAHIIETGTESFRFRRTIAGKRVGKAPADVSEGRASASP